MTANDGGAAASTDPGQLKVIDLPSIANYKPPPPRFLVQDLIPANVVTLLTAHGGTGKTTLAMQAAVCLAMGMDFFGKACQASKVLFYSAEDDEEQLLRLLSRICDALQVDPQKLAERLTVIDASSSQTILFAEAFLAKGVRLGAPTDAYDRLKEQIDAAQAEVVVIDNASDVFGADENNRTHVSTFIRLLTRLIRPRNGALLLIAHVDKSAARMGSKEAYSGSTAWHNSVRSRLLLTSDNDGQVLLEHQKSNRGKLSAPIQLRMEDGLLLPASSSGNGQYDGASVEVGKLMQIVRLIEEYSNRGEFISTSNTAHTNPYKLLSGDPDYPKRTDRRELHNMIRYAERQGYIKRESYKSNSRNSCERWKVVAFPASSPQESAKSTEEAQPASSPVGGMGGERDAMKATSPTQFDFSKLNLSAVNAPPSLPH
jgi:KaiC/GvpD/RAD55 family RecA-like ATPase